jgi:hypothetical protein
MFQGLLDEIHGKPKIKFPSFIKIVLKMVLLFVIGIVFLPIFLIIPFGLYKLNKRYKLDKIRQLEIEELVKNQSNNDSFFFDLAIQKEKKDDLQGAIDEITKAIEINKYEFNEERYYGYRAKLKEKIGDIDGAKQDYSKLKPLEYMKKSGAGEIICNNCDFKEYITILILNHQHGTLDGTVLGYQCQSCGKFHTLRMPIKVPFVCTCGGELNRHKVIFCPQCKSTNIRNERGFYKVYGD